MWWLSPLLLLSINWIRRFVVSIGVLKKPGIYLLHIKFAKADWCCNMSDLDLSVCDSASWPTDFTVYIFSFSSYVIDYLQMIIDRYCLITVRYIHILLLRFLIINFNTATSISATFYLFLHVPQKMPVYQINRLISDTIHQGDIRFGNTAGSTVCM